ncbi:hypothetical protein [Chitinimonas koreensis]|uniref:hypothetical protein n=1 Tax=Chitinimonas koreensis TaxID=356302 RepID=UPI0004196DE1|nr:hypothetical protein [Chitinimonas koreensis]QNM98123.1 hypothetical protein H9L41_07690 [Chitinimonas koreensis]
MKRTDLEKLRGLKIAGKLAGERTPDRFGKASTGKQEDAKPKGLMGALLKKTQNGD